MSRNGIVSDIKFHAKQGDPAKYGSPSPSPNAGVPQGARNFENVLADEDPEICLNCERPPEKCRGSHHCYMKGKKRHENRH